MWPIFLVHESIPFLKLRSRNHRRVDTSAARVALGRSIHRFRGRMMSLKLPYGWMMVHGIVKNRSWLAYLTRQHHSQWQNDEQIVVFWCSFVSLFGMTSIETSTKLPHDILQPLPSESIDIFGHLTDRLSGWANRWQNWRYISILPRADWKKWRNVPVFFTYLFFQVPPQINPQIISIYISKKKGCGFTLWLLLFKLRWVSMEGRLFVLPMTCQGWVEAELGHKVPTKNWHVCLKSFNSSIQQNCVGDLLNHLLLYVKMLRTHLGWKESRPLTLLRNDIQRPLYSGQSCNMKLWVPNFSCFKAVN